MKVTSTFLTLVLLAGGLDCSAADCSNPVRSFEMSDLFPWAIVPYDRLERGPEERLRMLKELGFSKYAYDWRNKHLQSMGQEFELARKMGIEVIGVWMWGTFKENDAGRLTKPNERFLEILTETKTKTCIWVGFHEEDFSGMSESERLRKGSEYLSYLDGRANEIGCTIAIYNHGGWIGDPLNQVKLIRETGQKDIGIVYSFHHGREHVDKFEKLATGMQPYLVAVVLNGMAENGPEIMTIGEGDHEAEMVKTLCRAGFEGPYGVLGHIQEEDVEVVLKRNLKGFFGLGKKSVDDRADVWSLETLAYDYKTAEGPVWDDRGILFFTEMSAHRIHKLDTSRSEYSIVREGSGLTIGMAQDAKGRLVFCEAGRTRVTRMEADGSITELWKADEDEPHGPNDIVISKRGNMYFTVPRQNRVYRRTSDGRVQALLEVEDPNGITLSRDEQTLYVTNFRSRNVLECPLDDALGKVGSQKLFASIETDGKGHGADGMTVDGEDRLYVTCLNGVWIYDQEGSLVGEIPLPGESVTNVVFEGNNYSRLYITTRKGLFLAIRK